MPLRRISLVLALLVVASGLTAADGSPTAPRPTTLATYCSPSGDVCFGIINRSGAAYLELATAAHYFDRYRLCVRPPRGGTAGLLRCGSFPVFRRASGWGSSVKYARQYPVVGPGTYSVTWLLGSKPLGPTLRFRLPLTG